MALSVLGFIERCSLQLVNEVVKLTVLCPSFEVAESLFKERQIRLDKKRIRDICIRLGLLGLENRGAISLNGQENLTGKSLLIGIDGGRLRERLKKKGRKRKGQKRCGYHTPWREPKLFTLYLLDEKGNKLKEWLPIYDATLGNHQQVFSLLESYLDQLDLSGLKRIIICGDGAGWIWNNVAELKKNFQGVDQEIIEVIDYTHAKQNLQEIIELLPRRFKTRERVIKEFQKQLWRGNIGGIYQLIDQHFSKTNKLKAHRKWCSYFYKNRERMCYESFKGREIPCGSGCVESAIRRVINMRLKAAGTFWIKENAECFLFLRSQLLSGRWVIFMENVRRNALKMILNEQNETRAIKLPNAA